jgi:hypothetical protein
METILNGGFHESTITTLALDGSTMTIGLEGVHRRNTIQDLVVIFLGVREVLVDGVPRGRIGMESDDGEVLTLDQTGNLIELIVLWNEYSPRKSTTASYRFVCEAVQIRLAGESETP